MTRRLITDADVYAAVAYWAVRQHPHHNPPHLHHVTSAVRKEAEETFRAGVPGLPLRWFADHWEVRAWLRAALEKRVSTILREWSTPGGGRGGDAFADAAARTPAEVDFVDIDALVQKASLMAWRYATDTRGEEPRTLADAISEREGR